MRSPRSAFASQTFFAVFVAIGLTIAATCSSSNAVAEDGLASEPYVVYVAHDEVHTRCGPSGDYYRTDPLRHGQELEVYVETEDGWLGVRPPENSFCWVPASTVQLSGSEDAGTIIEDRTVAWIGTHLGRARKYRWQVQMAEGEEVTIIGRSERDGPDGPQLWYRIVPPSGEFRWVHRDQTVESPEALVAAVRRQQQASDIEFLPVARTEPKQSQPTRRPGEVRGDEQTDNIKLASSDAARQLLEPEPHSGQVSGTHPYDPSAPISNSRNASSRRTIRSPGGTVTGMAPYQSPRRQASPQPVAANEIPTFRNAPDSRQHPSTLADASDEPIGSGVIGSGVRQDWQANAVRGSVEDGIGNSVADRPDATPQYASHENSNVGSSNLPARESTSIANASFIGKPRLIDIGSNLDASAPAADASAGDGNWVSGAARESGVSQVSGISPMPAQSLGIDSIDRNGPAPVNVVSREDIMRVEDEVRGADVEKLQLVLSRLMARRASSAETRPLIDEAYRVAQTTPDQVTAGRAKLLAERAEQYQRVAERRDGSGAAIRNHSLVIPAGGESSPSPLQRLDGISQAQPLAPPSSNSFIETGFLVQVYSARTNSPPFALTDHGGNTIAYVTPSPGINLRTHLNSRISVAGNRGYLQGLNTPHITVTKAVRARE
tara:strand:+ start:117447 stop:119435 length:1989 start_codon:yes stop_codon:yes gene_type:complete